MVDQLRVSLHSAKSPQRLGSLAMIALISSDSRSIGSKELAKSYRSLIARRKSVPEQDRVELENFLRKRNLLRKYDQPVRSVEVQDWLLADDSLGSGTGSERDDTLPTVECARAIGILTDSNARTWLGRLISSLPGIDLDAIRVGDRDPNPFRLTRAQMMVFTWAFVRMDLDVTTFISHCLARASTGGSVTMNSLFDCVAEDIPVFVEQIGTYSDSAADRVAIDGLGRVVNSLSRSATGRKAGPGGVTEQTLRRSFEEFLYWRTEWLVDLGFLSKPDPGMYEYVANHSLANLSSPLVATKNGTVDSFFQWLSICWGTEATPLSPVETFDVIRASNRKHANSMGYSLIEEAVLGANVSLLSAGVESYIEEGTLRELLANPPAGAKVLTSVDRNRRVSAFKVVE